MHGTARPKEEVDAIMGLLDKYIDEIDDYSAKTRAKVVFIGGLEPFSEERRKRIEGVAQKTSKEREHTLNVALNYDLRSIETSSRLPKSGQSVSVKNSSEYALCHMRKFESLDSPPVLMIIRGFSDSCLRCFPECACLKCISR